MADVKTVKRPKQLKGAKAAQFRRDIDRRLAAMGYTPGIYVWQPSPARLLVLIQGQLRLFSIHAGMRRTELERQLGRLETWAEVMGLTPRPVVAVAKPPMRDVIQIDLERAIAAKNGSAHASA